MAIFTTINFRKTAIEDQLQNGSSGLDLSADFLRQVHR
jgi:hypothetical protein